MAHQARAFLEGELTTLRITHPNAGDELATIQRDVLARHPEWARRLAELHALTSSKLGGRWGSTRRSDVAHDHSSAANAEPDEPTERSSAPEASASPADRKPSRRTSSPSRTAPAPTTTPGHKA